MKKVVFFILFVSASLYVQAQNLEFKASAVPKLLRVGEQFQLIYELNQDVSGVEIPDFNDFQLLGGPMTSSSTSIQIVNGKTTQSSQYTYTYYLRAVKEGTFSILPAKAKYKGKLFESNSLSIEVISGGTQAQQQNPGTQGSGQKQSTADQTINSGQDVYVRLHVDKKSVYLGEQIVAWIKLYTKVNISGIDQQFKGPEYTGFYKQIVDIPPIRSLERENVNGEIYYTGIIQKVVLYPQKSGELTIEPFDLQVSVQQQVKSRSRSIFDEFFGPTVTDIPLTLKSNSVKINVRPLPAKPGAFTGAVGNFTLKSGVDKTTLKTNEALTYKYTITGKGNIKLIDEPSIEFPPNVEKFDPKTTVNQSSELSGSKTFEYVLIPRTAGEYTIPPSDFVYFDPTKGSYVSLRTDEYKIYVEKGLDDTSTVVISGLSKEDFRILSSDILFIKNKPFKITDNNTFIFGSDGFYLIYIITFVLFILIVIFRKETIKRNANIRLVKNRKASKVARKRLKKAHIYLKHNKQDEFYEEIVKAIWGYLSDKLSIPVAELSRERSKDQLVKRGINDEFIGEFYKLLDECEYARYAPGMIQDGMDQKFRKAEEIIEQLDQKLK